jgi:hypothetical protein
MHRRYASTMPCITPLFLVIHNSWCRHGRFVIIIIVFTCFEPTAVPQCATSDQKYGSFQVHDMLCHFPEDRVCSWQWERLRTSDPMCGPTSLSISRPIPRWFSVVTREERWERLDYDIRVLVASHEVQREVDKPMCLWPSMPIRQFHQVFTGQSDACFKNSMGSYLNTALFSFRGCFESDTTYYGVAVPTDSGGLA